MSEDELSAVDHKLAGLQRRRSHYVKRLAVLDPRENAVAFNKVLSRIDEVNAALIRLSRALSR